MNTILVIDDNHDYRADIMEILNFENYATLEAENGLHGVDMIRQHSPNLILCDIDMPVMNGIEVLKTIKADSLYAKIPFILVTANNDIQLKRLSHELGVATYLTKPINITTLLETLVHFLQEETTVLLN